MPAKLNWAGSACDGWVNHFMWAFEHSNNPWEAWWHAGDPCVLFSFTSEATDMQNLACYRCKAAYWCMSATACFYVGHKVQSCQCRRHKAIRKRERMQTAASACLWCALKHGALDITLILIMRFLFSVATSSCSWLRRSIWCKQSLLFISSSPIIYFIAKKGIQPMFSCIIIINIYLGYDIYRLMHFYAFLNA